MPSPRPRASPATRSPRSRGRAPPWLPPRIASCAPRGFRRPAPARTCPPGSPSADPISAPGSCFGKVLGMAVELDHSFSTARPIDDSYATILDLERVIPCVEGGSVLEATSPESVKAEIKVRMGAMSMTFTGTVEIVEQDAASHTVLMRVKSKEAGGQGHANADVAFALEAGSGPI